MNIQCIHYRYFNLNSKHIHIQKGISENEHIDLDFLGIQRIGGYDLHQISEVQ